MKIAQNSKKCGCALTIGDPGFGRFNLTKNWKQQ